jgi:hypothetical protein
MEHHVGIALLLTTAMSAQRTWIVGHRGGPGVDFTAIQPAVDASSAGDRVEIRSNGPYASFTALGTEHRAHGEVNGLRVSDSIAVLIRDSIGPWR